MQRRAPAGRAAGATLPGLRGDRSGAARQSRAPDLRAVAGGPRAAYLDWLLHLAFAPGRRAQLADKALRKTVRLVLDAARAAADPETAPCIEPLAQDRRFAGEDWRR